jgi:beta-galactosidase
MKQQGVGGYDSWAAPTQPGFTIPGNESYNWAFSIVPIQKVADVEKNIAVDYFKK